MSKNFQNKNEKLKAKDNLHCVWRHDTLWIGGYHTTSNEGETFKMATITGAIKIASPIMRAKERHKE